MKLHDNITTIKGIGPKKAEAFSRIGIETIEDLIFTLPRIYEDRRNVVPVRHLKEGEAAVFAGKVDLVYPSGFSNRGRRILKMLISDDTGSVEVVFFNAAYLATSVKQGDFLVCFGVPRMNRGRLQVVHPEFEKTNEVRGEILPVYPLTKGISQREMRRIQRIVKPLYAQVPDILPDEIIHKYRLCGITYALENIHFPDDKKKLLEGKYRLVFDEFMVLETGLMAAGKESPGSETPAVFSGSPLEEEYIESMPFPLTSAQERCIKEVMSDLSGPKAMNRLVQGDVGSGKTAIAEIAMFKAVRSGYQAVMMAPTEILARQHYDGLRAAFAKHGIKVEFLSGSMKASDKRAVLAEIEDGSAEIVVGTHAVIQPEVKFRNLGLVITDEQHRFGVNQRIRLKEKGVNPNVMVMTATPIPRTLAVVLYGDMDVSVIDEMPPGRQPVKTRCIEGDEARRKCYEFVKRQIQQGRQAYVVTPLIDASEAMDARSASDVYKELSLIFERTALLHGGMKQSEKDEIMGKFNDGQIDVLVATVVIEVGINVPNATVMVVENAERFGLAQLHQLRGRVGRGRFQSYCFIVLGSDSKVARRRGEIMEESSDGFYIAEEDLKIRGPGEIFGTRQHGLPDMKIADMVRHMDVLIRARDEAKAIIEEDPRLLKEDNQPLKNRVIKLFGEDFSLNL
ncbi:MAG: ATP-dependent DNA helicase RecG [Lentihominibacter sp.]